MTPSNENLRSHFNFQKDYVQSFPICKTFFDDNGCFGTIFEKKGA